MQKLRPLRPAQWPAPDRLAWEAAFTPARRLFSKVGAGAHLRARTRDLYRCGYGIWMANLARLGELVDDERPAARVTAARLDAMIAWMRELGHADSTIRTYLMSLHSALRLLDPTSNTSHIIRPHGRPLTTYLRAAPKPFAPLDTEDVMRRVIALHQSGKVAPCPRTRRDALRDAALLALFLRRGPRVSTVAAMRLGTHLVEQGDGRLLCRFGPDDLKTRRRLSWNLDAECAELMRDYCRIARPGFDGAAGTDALWLNEAGQALSVPQITTIFRAHIHAWFQIEAGPHTARKWLRSTAARRSPQAAFDAAEVLGHTPQVSLRHYAEASEIAAAQRLANHLRALRRKSESLAARLFAEAELTPQPGEPIA